jgi:signal transduction histidine kinase
MITLMTKKVRSSLTDHAPAPKTHKGSVNLPDARPLVLIVEDEPDVAELIRYNLAREGYATLIAESGDKAVDEALQSTPDLILLDIMLPGMNGWEVCQTIRDSAKGRHVPIIMVSALTTEESRIKGLSLGADDYIIKPFSVQELLIKVRNIVGRYALVKKLRLREQDQDTAMRYMVHELRNSLSSIGGFSSLALQKDHANKYLRTINNAACHAESLLNDASLLSRLEGGKERLSIGPVEVGVLVDESADFLRDAAKGSKIEITVKNSATALVQGNRTAIRQIMINLISNAIKYNRSGGKVLISFDAENDRVNISIQDEGNGITQAELSRIFDKFYRATGSEQVKGAGLGLYIVKLLTDAMGGEITVVSRQGKGSTFTVSLILHEGNTAAVCRR